MIFQKNRCGWVNISGVISGDDRLNFTKYILFNAGLNVVDNAVYHFSMSLYSPEIFAVKLESCRKTY